MNIGIATVPDVLFHRVLGGYSGEGTESIETAIKSIMEIGLRPKVAEEYKGTVPVEIRELPIVWLGQSFSSDIDHVLSIRTKDLDPENLYDLHLTDVHWWVYQGEIPRQAIRRVVCNMGATKKSEVNNFAVQVLKALDLDGWRLEWTKENGSECLREQRVILIQRPIGGWYPWEAKEMVLHEITHIFTLDKFHCEVFYREYVLLLKRFMIDDPL